VLVFLTKIASISYYSDPFNVLLNKVMRHGAYQHVIVCKGRLHIALPKISRTLIPSSGRGGSNAEDCEKTAKPADFSYT